MNKLTKFMFVLGYFITTTGCAVQVSANTGTGKNIESVFGGVDVGKNSKVGNVSSVNGGVDIASGVTALNVETVNGGIDIDNNVKVKSVETVNGSIDAGMELMVSKGLETVNGGVRVKNNSHIGGSVLTVNGDIELINVAVGKNLKTVNGDVKLTEGTVIEGDLVVEKPGNWFPRWNNDKPTIEIDETSSVNGTIHLYRDVKLEISEKAKVNPVVKHYLRK